MCFFGIPPELGELWHHVRGLISGSVHVIVEPFHAGYQRLKVVPHRSNDCKHKSHDHMAVFSSPKNIWGKETYWNIYYEW